MQQRLSLTPRVLRREYTNLSRGDAGASSSPSALHTRRVCYALLKCSVFAWVHFASYSNKKSQITRRNCLDTYFGRSLMLILRRDYVLWGHFILIYHAHYGFQLACKYFTMFLQFSVLHQEIHYSLSLFCYSQETLINCFIYKKYSLIQSVQTRRQQVKGHLSPHPWDQLERIKFYIQYSRLVEKINLLATFNLVNDILYC